MPESGVPEPEELRSPGGYKPGDTPSGLQWPMKLWVVLPSSLSSAQVRMYRSIIQYADLRDLRVSPVRVRDVKGKGGIAFKLLDAQDVAALYRSVHRFRVGVIALSGAKILLDISEKPSNRGCVSLQHFVRYKAAFRMVSRIEELEGALQEVDAWLATEECEGPKDPRCLPMQIFGAKVEEDLSEREGRRRFVDSHLGPAVHCLVDKSYRSWQVGPHHTKDLLQVAGRCLPLGFHWDVQIARDGVITNGWERWHLPRGAYTNIHPDAMVRGSQGTRTHSLGSIEAGTWPEPRTPRANRREQGKKRNAPR